MSSPLQTCTPIQGERSRMLYPSTSQAHVLSAVHAPRSQHCPPASLHRRVWLQRQLAHASCRAHGGVPEQGEPSLGHAHLLLMVAYEWIGACTFPTALYDSLWPPAEARSLVHHHEQIGHACNHELGRTRLQREAVSPRAVRDTCMSTTEWHCATGP